MPALSCSAIKCIYNNEHFCGKGDILVTGEHAEESRETCCSSFCENESGQAKNSIGEPSREIWVDCTASNCRYNEEDECQAEKISIAGASACQCGQTECSTFDCRK